MNLFEFKKQYLKEGILIKPELTKPNIPQIDYKDRIKVSDKDIKLKFCLMRSGPFYEMDYFIIIDPKIYNVDPSYFISSRDVDMVSLRNALNKKIDNKYLKIVKFDLTKVTIRFDHDLWIKDTTSGVLPQFFISRFDKRFRLKIFPPKILLTDYITLPLEKFILDKFMIWVEKNERRLSLLPQKVSFYIRTKIRNMFDWSYDLRTNCVIARLKNIYIIALLYATGLSIQALSEKNITASQRNLFAIKVEKYSPQFDRKKWEKFAGKNFL